MIRETIRAMTSGERAELESRLTANDPAPGLARPIAIGLGLLAVSFAPVAVFFGWFLPLNAGITLTVVVGVITFLVGFGTVFIGGNMISSVINLRRARRHRASEFDPRIHAALHDGRVKVLAVEASSVVFFEQFEDEGDGYLFEAGPISCLILKGQEACPESEGMPWPASHFEIVSTAVSDIRIGLFSSGDRLVPRATIPLSETNEDFLWDERLEVVSKPVNEVLQSLLKPDSGFRSSQTAS